MGWEGTSPLEGCSCARRKDGRAICGVSEGFRNRATAQACSNRCQPSPAFDRSCCCGAKGCASNAGSYPGAHRGWYCMALPAPEHRLGRGGGRVQLNGTSACRCAQRHRPSEPVNVHKRGGITPDGARSAAQLLHHPFWNTRCCAAEDPAHQGTRCSCTASNPPHQRSPGAGHALPPCR